MLILDALLKVALLVILLLQILNTLSVYLIRSNTFQQELAGGLLSEEVNRLLVGSAVSELTIGGAWLLLLYVFKDFSHLWLVFFILEIGSFIYTSYQYKHDDLANNPQRLAKFYHKNIWLIIAWIQLFCVVGYAYRILR